MDWLYSLDAGILFFIQEHLRCAFLDPVMVFVSALGNTGFIWLAVTAVFFCLRSKRRMGAALLLALMLSFLLGNIALKNLVARPRPFVDFPDVALLIPPPGEFSFPSGHTLSSFAAAGVIFAADRRLGIGAFCLAGLIGFSRMYLFVHYPSDVLAGALLGLVVAWAAVWFARRGEVPDAAEGMDGVESQAGKPGGEG